MGDFAFDFEAEIDSKDTLRKASVKADGPGLGAYSAVGSRGRQNIVCRHWLKNLCMRGDRCDHLHEFDPSRMPECNFWLRYGKCSDPDCTFKHVSDSDRPDCQRYRLGFCKFGVMCRSRHERLPRESLPDIMPDWFLNALISNAHVIPRTDDLSISELRDRFRHGSALRNGGGGRDRDRDRGGDRDRDRDRGERDRDRDRGGGAGAATKSLSSSEQGTIPGLLAPIFGKCRYFVMRSMNVRNIQISVAKGIWATGSGNSNKLRQALRDVDHIILVFSATESRAFAGYAKMLYEPDDLLLPGVWGEMSSRLSPNFRIHWLKQCSTPMGKADHIRNPQNDDLPVRRCRDGQELPSSVGERLCRFLWHEPDFDIVEGSDLEFEPRISYSSPPVPPSNALAAGALALPAPAAAPALALEDGRAPGKEGGGGEADNGAARPAPSRLGTFGPGGVSKSRSAAGPPRASGSSSVMAALAEETHRSGVPAFGAGANGGPPSFGAWQPPQLPPAGPPGWPYGHPPPHLAGPPAHAGFYPPPAGHGPPPPGYYPAPGMHNGGYGAPPAGALPAAAPASPPQQLQQQPFQEAQPPGVWGGNAPAPLDPATAIGGGGGGDRVLALPPSSWEGAGAGGGGDARSRSRSRARRRGRRR